MVKSDTAEDKFLEQHKQFTLRDTVTYPNGGWSKFMMMENAAFKD